MKFKNLCLQDAKVYSLTAQILHPCYWFLLTKAVYEKFGQSIVINNNPELPLYLEFSLHYSTEISTPKGRQQPGHCKNLLLTSCFFSVALLFM